MFTMPTTSQHVITWLLMTSHDDLNYLSRLGNAHDDLNYLRRLGNAHDDLNYLRRLGNAHDDLNYSRRHKLLKAA